MQTAITRTSGPGRVLLVEDHPAVRRVLRSLLEEVDRLKDEFLAMVSHELCTPITVVLGMAQTLVGRVVRGMGGRVWVEDNQGGGARLVVELPDQAPVQGGPGREPPGHRSRPRPMNASKHLPLLAGLLLAGLLLAACADPDGGPARGGPTTAPTTPTTRATGPTRPAGQVTLTGTVRAGVEPGCLLLDAGGGGPYLLVGGERAELRPGVRVAVTGRVERDLLSTCQQGEPLVVASIEPAP